MRRSNLAMRYTLLGKTGLRVSEICLGAMGFGEDKGWGSDRSESLAAFRTFVDAGGNFLDTANTYTNGTSEQYLGEFVAGSRDRYVLATKYTIGADKSDPNASGNHRKNMRNSLEASLRRLKTDYIDLYWLHIWDFLTPEEEVMRSLDDLVRSGKVLYIGISDTPAWIVARSNMMAQLRGWTSFAALQIEYSLIQRTPERELLPMAEALDLTVTPWGPMGMGVLSGRFRQGRKPEVPTSRRPIRNGLLSERTLSIARVVGDVAEECGGSSAQVAINWLRQGGVGRIVPIVGARTGAQAVDSLKCLEFALSQEQMARLDEISAIELGFPHDFFREPGRELALGAMADRIDDPRQRRPGSAVRGYSAP